MVLAFVLGHPLRTLTTSLPGVVSAGDHHMASLTPDGTAWLSGANGYGQLGDGITTRRTILAQMSGLNGALGVMAGSSHAVLWKNANTAWTWRNNDRSTGLVDASECRSDLSLDVLGAFAAPESEEQLKRLHVSSKRNHA